MGPSIGTVAMRDVSVEAQKPKKYVRENAKRRKAAEKKKGKAGEPGTASDTEEEEDGPKKDSDTIDMEGEITNVLSNGMFRVKLENGMEIMGILAGKMRINNIRVGLGDNVKVAISPYDLTKGRIVFRERRPFRPPPK